MVLSSFPESFKCKSCFENLIHLFNPHFEGIPIRLKTFFLIGKISGKRGRGPPDTLKLTKDLDFHSERSLLRYLHMKVNKLSKLKLVIKGAYMYLLIEISGFPDFLIWKMWGKLK